MKEILFMGFCVSLFGFGSFWLHSLMFRAGRLFFFILCIAYIVASFYLFSIIVYLDQALDPQGIHFNFGHDSSMLVKMLFVWLGIAFVNIIMVCVRRFGKH